MSNSRLDWYRVSGDCMWPALRSGDEVGLARPRTGPRPGDVVVARVPGSFVVHRVVSIASGSVVLRGDNCDRDDPRLPVERLLGVARRVRRSGKILASSEWDSGPTLAGRLRMRLRRRLAGLLHGRFR